MTGSTTPKNKLQGKVAIITGGASGIGEATARHFATHGARAIVIADVKTLVYSIVNTYGQLDIMFSNTVLEIDLSAYDKLMAVNARGMVACVKHAAKAMVEGRVRGSIICTASMAASIGTDRFVDYAMSKHAVLGLVAGAVGTPLLKDMFRFEKDGEADKVLVSSSNLKGRVLMPKNVADAVVFLASEDSQFVTGHNLVVDAGFKS
ncbi:hypothetical protein ACJW30_04G117100 [Castanea mollissima]